MNSEKVQLQVKYFFGIIGLFFLILAGLIFLAANASAELIVSLMVGSLLLTVWVMAGRAAEDTLRDKK